MASVRTAASDGGNHTSGSRRHRLVDASFNGARRRRRLAWRLLARLPWLGRSCRHRLANARLQGTWRRRRLAQLNASNLRYAHLPPDRYFWGGTLLYARLRTATLEQGGASECAGSARWESWESEAGNPAGPGRHVTCACRFVTTLPISVPWQSSRPRTGRPSAPVRRISPESLRFRTWQQEGVLGSASPP